MHARACICVYTWRVFSVQPAHPTETEIWAIQRVHGRHEYTCVPALPEVRAGGGFALVFAVSIHKADFMQMRTGSIISIRWNRNTSVNLTNVFNTYVWNIRWHIRVFFFPFTHPFLSPLFLGLERPIQNNFRRTSKLLPD